MFLNELVNEEIQASEQDKTEQVANKMIFIILNMVTSLAFIMNIFLNPIAKELYFYTTLGNTLILFWVFVIVAGITASLVIEQI
ncbi:hypothetical protein [Thermotalea metallivorans]|uniref:Uncharacterized protein n=1 Tax=Thermotalea metallivorans TaxID=520762 RepID=A0A140KZK4_9FIRM|nr:hypothetical protein [Thermotalea metallivorans]KXG73729.1 hypothetical protein AN619_29470 [Thermotalea metallivorans]